MCFKYLENANRRTKGRFSDEVTNPNIPLSEARDAIFAISHRAVHGVEGHPCINSTQRMNCYITMLPQAFRISAPKHEQNKHPGVTCNLKLIGLTGIQAAVIKENNQTIEEQCRCSSTCVMHMKNKPSKDLLVLPNSDSLRDKFK